MFRGRITVALGVVFLTAACGRPHEEVRIPPSADVFAGSESLLRTEGTAPSPAQASASPTVSAFQIGGTPMEDHSVGVAFDAGGGRIAHFSSWEGTVSSARGYFERRAPSGELLWAKTFTGEAYRAVVNDAGESFLWVVVSGFGQVVVKFSTEGDVVWAHRVPGQSLLMAPGPDGDLYALASTTLPVASTTLLRVTSDGVVSVIAERPFGSSCPWSDQAVWNGTDRIAVVCEDRTVRAFDNRFNPLWEFRPLDIGGGVVPDIGFHGLQFTPDGGAVVAWEGNVTSIAPDGVSRWTRRFGAVGDARLAVDRSGNIGAWIGGEIHLLEPAGNALWSAPVPAPLEVKSLAFDPNGRLTVAGLLLEEIGGVTPQGRTDVFAVQLE